MAIWNPWHGCHKISSGCLNCYVYRRDEEIGKDSQIVTKTAKFDYPVKKDRNGNYKLQPESIPVYTCMTSDFFLDEADQWREEVWAMIKMRPELHFYIITKRIHRFAIGLPEDWGDGYDHVTICCTCENQEQADYRLPIFFEMPIKHREIIHEPMLGEIQIEQYLAAGVIEGVTCGGESGIGARLCDYNWVLNSMNQCIAHQVPFYFKQTGGKFKKGNKIYFIQRKDQMTQATKAGINYHG